jgi:hypothetical protein
MQLGDRHDEARAGFAHAIELAQAQHDYRVEATARIALLGIETYDSEAPGDPDRATRVIAETRAAVARAGSDPALVLAVDGLVADIDAGQGRYTKAIEAFEHTRKKFLELQGCEQAADAAASELRALVRRDSLHDLDTALRVGIETMQALEAAGAPAHTRLAREVVQAAWRSGALDMAHVRADQLPDPAALPDAIRLSGRVVRADGKPAVGARVVAWRDELVGDATRLYTMHDFQGDDANADDTGAFTLRVPPDGAIMAELGSDRSSVVRLASPNTHALVLTLAPTHSVSGIVHSGPLLPGGLEARVRVSVDAHTWILRAPVTSDGSFTLAGVPAAADTVTVELDGHRIASPVRDGRVEITFPPPVSFEVIWRQPAPAGVVAYLFRGQHDVSTHQQLDALARSSRDVAIVRLHAVGFASQTTDMLRWKGADGYERNDLHAVFPCNWLFGKQTICYEQSPTDALECHIQSMSGGHELVIRTPPTSKQQ